MIISDRWFLINDFGFENSCDDFQYGTVDNNLSFGDSWLLIDNLGLVIFKKC